MPQWDVMALLLTWFAGSNDGPGPVVCVAPSGHRARVQVGARATEDEGRPKIINLTDSSEAPPTNTVSGTAEALNNGEDGIPMLEYSKNDMQRINDSVEESQQEGNKAE